MQRTETGRILLDGFIVINEGLSDESVVSAQLVMLSSDMMANVGILGVESGAFDMKGRKNGIEVVEDLFDVGNGGELVVDIRLCHGRSHHFNQTDGVDEVPDVKSQEKRTGRTKVLKCVESLRRILKEDVMQACVTQLFGALEFAPFDLVRAVRAC